MENSELFRKTAKSLIDRMPKGAQVRIADELGIGRTYMNDFLKGRKMLSESKREQIAEKLGYSYIDFLILGREMFSDKRGEHNDETVSDIESTLEHAILIFEESVTTMFGKEMSMRLPYEIEATTIVNIYNSIAKRMTNNSIVNAIDIDQLIKTLKYCDSSKSYCDETFEESYAELEFESAIQLKSGILSSLYMDIDEIIDIDMDEEELYKILDDDLRKTDEKIATSNKVTSIKEYLKRKNLKLKRAA